MSRVYCFKHKVVTYTDLLKEDYDKKVSSKQRFKFKSCGCIVMRKDLDRYDVIEERIYRLKYTGQEIKRMPPKTTDIKWLLVNKK